MKKKSFYRPIIADIAQTRVFIYHLREPLDLQDYFLRMAEAFVLEMFLNDTNVRAVTPKMYDAWCQILNIDNSFETSLYGLFMDEDHILKFIELFSATISEKEQSVINLLIEQKCLSLKYTTYSVEKRFSFIVINDFLCKEDNLFKDDILMHELSHVLYRYDRDYRKFVNATFRSSGKLYQSLIAKKLQGKYGYGEARIEDEWAAYMLDNQRRFANERKYCRSDVESRIRKKFKNKLFLSLSEIHSNGNNILNRLIKKLEKRK